MKNSPAGISVGLFFGLNSHISQDSMFNGQGVAGMEVQAAQPEKNVVSSSLKLRFFVCGLALWIIAFVESQLHTGQYSGGTSLAQMVAGMGCVMFARGLYHSWVPVARFSEHILYLRPTPLHGCHDVAYSLIDDYIVEDKKLILHYRDVSEPDGRVKFTMIKSHQVGIGALDQMILILRQRVK